MLWWLYTGGLTSEWFGLGPTPLSSAWIGPSGEINVPITAPHSVVIMDSPVQNWLWVAGVSPNGRLLRQLLPVSVIRSIWGTPVAS